MTAIPYDTRFLVSLEQVERGSCLAFPRSASSQGGDAAAPGPGKARKHDKDLSFNALVDHYIDDTSLPAGEAPRFVVLMGAPAVGKTTLRKKKYSSGYVLVDAADIFVTMSDGEYFDFPGPLEGMMNVVGSFIAQQAISERRHIVTEIIGTDYSATRLLLDSMLAAGYQIQIESVQCPLEVAIERNENRGDDCVSAYYAEPYHRDWLVRAATLAAQRRNG